MASVDVPVVTATPGSRLENAQRDVVVLVVLITAVVLLIWNGSTFFQHLRIAGDFGPEVRVASTALTLNVALILFGWRRYVDLQHEAEMRAEQEQRAAYLPAPTPHRALQSQGLRRSRRGNVGRGRGAR